MYYVCNSIDLPSVKSSCLHFVSFSFLCFPPQRNYVAAWDAEKIKVHLPADIPELLLAKANAYNISKVLFVCTNDEDNKIQVDKIDFFGGFFLHVQIKIFSYVSICIFAFEMIQ